MSTPPEALYNNLLVGFLLLLGRWTSDWLLQHSSTNSHLPAMTFFHPIIPHIHIFTVPHSLRLVSIFVLSIWFLFIDIFWVCYILICCFIGCFSVLTIPPLKICAVFTSLPPHNAKPFTTNSYLLSQRDCCSEVRKMFGLVITDTEKKGNKYKSPLAEKEEIHKVT